MQREELFEEVIEKQRVEYYEVTQKNIEKLVELIETRDKGFATKVVDWLKDI